MKKTFLLAFLLIVNILSSIAQSSIIDSLVDRLNYTTDTNLIILYNQIAQEYRKSDLDQSLVYAKRGLEEAKKINNKDFVGRTYNTISSSYFYIGEIDSAITYLDSSFKIYQYVSNNELKYKVITNLGIFNSELKKYPLSNEYLYTALSYYEKNNNEKASIPILNCLAQNLMNTKLNLKAEEYFNKSITLCDKYNIISSKIVALSGLANLATYQHEDYALSINLLKQVAQLASQSQNNFRLGQAFQLIGDNYLALNKYDSALQNYKKALIYNDAVGNAEWTYTTKLGIGNCYSKLNQFQQAKVFLLEAYNGIESLDNKRDKLVAYQDLAEYYIRTGDKNKALLMFEKFTYMNDSVYNIASVENMTEMQTKYETEKKETQITLQQLQLKNQKSALITLSLFILMGGLGIWLFVSKKQAQQKSLNDAVKLKLQQETTRAILNAEEKERVRISRELHDGVGPILSLAKMQLENGIRQIKLENLEQESNFKNTSKMIDEAVSELRNLSHDLMPNSLLKHGLVSATREFLDRLSHTGAVKVSLTINNLDERLSPTVETVLYRVIQELVNNVIKHANASELFIQLIKHDDNIVMLVEDNGTGFEVNNKLEQSGIGLKNIKARIEFLNGKIHWDSTINRGTTVNLEIPLNQFS